MTSSNSTKVTHLSTFQGLGSKSAQDINTATRSITKAKFQLDKLNTSIPFSIYGGRFEMTRLSEENHDSNHADIADFLSHVKGQNVNDQSPDDDQRILHLASQVFETEDSTTYRVDHIEESEREIHALLTVSTPNTFPAISVVVLNPEEGPGEANELQEDPEDRIDLHTLQLLYTNMVETMSQEIMKSFDGVEKIEEIPSELVESGELDTAPTIFSIEGQADRSRWLQEIGWRKIGTVQDDEQRDILIKK